MWVAQEEQETTMASRSVSTKSQDIFPGQVPGCFHIAQAESRKAATGLLSRYGDRTERAKEFYGGLTDFRVEIIGCTPHEITEFR